MLGEPSSQGSAHMVQVFIPREIARVPLQVAASLLIVSEELLYDNRTIEQVPRRSDIHIFRFQSFQLTFHVLIYTILDSMLGVKIRHLSELLTQL